MAKLVWIMILIFTTIAGCSAFEVATPALNAFQSPLPLPPNAVYLLSARPSFSLATPALAVIDPVHWQTMQTSPFPQSAQPNRLYRDPLGRIWSTAFLRCELLSCYFIDYRLRVFSAAGRLAHWMPPPCPVQDLLFSAERAFLLCEYDQIIVLNLATLATEQVIQLAKPNERYFLRTGAIERNHLLVVAATLPLTGDAYTLITLFDLNHLQIQAQLRLTEPVDLVQTLVYQERFYLLNAGSRHALGEPVNDILIVDSQNFSTTTYLITPEAAPGRGKLAGDDLYLLHDRPYEDPNTLQERIVSHLNLRTGKTEKWTLPGYNQWTDLALLKQRIVLVNNRDLYDFPIPNPPGFMSGGLYELDQTSGRVQQLLAFGQANRILVAP